MAQRFVRLALARVLYEDEYLLLALKPKMVLTCPFASASFSLLSFLLCRQFSNAAAAHRLDYGTCGVIAVYKLNSVCVSLARQFYNSDVIKKYVCLSVCAAGAGASANNMCVFSNLSVLCANALKLSLLDCKLIAGKRHQIRLTRRGVCGDRLYCVSVQLHGIWACLIYSLRYQCLSAYLICLRHVVSAKLLIIERALEPLFRYVLVNFLKLSAVQL
ncbi:MAG: pseudouridine synthase [Candidatus Hodgkinia cicadicola]